jgi:hypothetical protein
VQAFSGDPLGPVVVETGGAAPPTGYASVVVTARNPGDIHLLVRATGAATVVVLQSYSADWVARVDGSRTTLMPADVLFQAIRVPSGVHRVTLDYQPASVTQGASVSLLALLILFASAVLPFAIRRVRRRG